MLMSLLMLCDSYRIQTCNLLIRSQMLGTFLILCKFFDNFFQKKSHFLEKEHF